MRMEKELDHMLEGLEASNRESCKRHFMKIIETSIMRNQPDKYVRSLLMEMYTEMLGMRGNADFVGRAAAEKARSVSTYQTGAERES